MWPLDSDIERRAKEYAGLYGLSLYGRLGYGKDGTVWHTSGDTALKVSRIPEPFRRELAAYRRLASHDVASINGFAVPRLLRADERLMAIEMSVVSPPFVLDFGCARLDGDAVEFSDETMEEWLADKRDEFGDRWPRVAGVLSALRRLGIHMTDVHPGNIMFENPPMRRGSSS